MQDFSHFSAIAILFIEDDSPKGVGSFESSRGKLAFKC